MKKFKNSVVGGTFDNLHKGHKYLLDKTFERSKKVIIGLTSDDFVSYKNQNQFIQSYSTRKKNLIMFLKEKKYFMKAKVVKINDIYGITLKKRDIDAIIVTPDTFENVLKINAKRKELKLTPIEIVKIDLINDELKKPISSTNIRIGEINDFGNYYKKIFETKDEFRLNPKFRNDFKKPIGKVIKKIDKGLFQDKFIIAVGDVAVAKLYENKIIPNISVFDLITKREKVSNDVLSKLPKPDLVLKNQQGTINSKTALKLGRSIKNSFEKGIKVAIKIVGEEDLLAIPATLFAPIGSIVLYGQRNIGGILVNVSLNKKKEVESFISKFN